MIEYVNWLFLLAKKHAWWLIIELVFAVGYCVSLANWSAGLAVVFFILAIAFPVSVPPLMLR